MYNRVLKTPFPSILIRLVSPALPSAAWCAHTKLPGFGCWVCLPSNLNMLKATNHLTILRKRESPILQWVSIKTSYMFQASVSQTVTQSSTSQGRAALLQLILNSDHIRIRYRVAISSTVRHVSPTSECLCSFATYSAATCRAALWSSSPGSQELHKALLFWCWKPYSRIPDKLFQNYRDRRPTKCSCRTMSSSNLAEMGHCQGWMPLLSVSPLMPPFKALA